MQPGLILLPDRTKHSCKTNNILSVNVKTYL